MRGAPQRVPHRSGRPGVGPGANARNCQNGLSGASPNRTGSAPSLPRRNGSLHDADVCRWWPWPVGCSSLIWPHPWLWELQLGLLGGGVGVGGHLPDLPAVVVDPGPLGAPCDPGERCKYSEHRKAVYNKRILRRGDGV